MKKVAITVIIFIIATLMIVVQLPFYIVAAILALADKTYTDAADVLAEYYNE